MCFVYVFFICFLVVVFSLVKLTMQYDANTYTNSVDSYLELPGYIRMVKYIYVCSATK